MQGLDLSVYKNQRGAADIMGGLQEGMKFGQLIKQNRIKNEERANQTKLKDLMANEVRFGDDGFVSADSTTMGEIAKLSPEAAMGLSNKMGAQNKARQAAEMRSQQYADSRSDKERTFGMQDRAFEQSNERYADSRADQERNFGLKEKAFKQDGQRYAQTRSDKDRDYQLRVDALKQKSQKEFMDARNKGAENFVPGLGVAYTKDDAKKLKDSKEMKNKFDRELGEMIKLREDYGSEFGNREAVARGQQLSKKLLLTYKNLAKLGVLSKSDEDIVNAIIPSDPLQFDMSKLVGQDPTLHALKKFKSDLDSDYTETLNTRIKEPIVEGYANKQVPQGLKFDEVTKSSDYRPKVGIKPLR